MDNQNLQVNTFIYRLNPRDDSSNTSLTSTEQISPNKFKPSPKAKRLIYIDARNFETISPREITWTVSSENLHRFTNYPSFAIQRSENLTSEAKIRYIICLCCLVPRPNL
jgi:hypothetical protein